MGSEQEFRIEPATRGDVPLILRMIKSLADYEQLSDRVVATESQLRDALFGPRPFADVVIAYAGKEPTGFAVFFPSFSTFAGTPGLYLEDLFVEPQWRGQGMGRRLLAHVANVAVTRGWPRVNWSVLDWNDRAIRFYRGLGAEPVKDWMGFGISGDALTRLAQGATHVDGGDDAV
jgi:GNAT superfamily N-acetyltransferase